VDALLAADSDPDGWVQAMRVQAAAPDAAAKAEVWQALAVDRKVPLGLFSRVASAFWQPGQDVVLTDFAHRYLDLLPELERGGMLPAMVYSAGLFPVFGADAALVDAIERATEASGPVVRAQVGQRADVVRRMLRSRGR
jgi:aminopeptidase N